MHRRAGEHGEADRDSGQQPVDESRHQRPRRQAAVADLDGDLEQNYAPDVVVFSREGVRVGHPAIRETAAILATYVDAEHYEIVQLDRHGPMAYLRWRAHGEAGVAHDGVDTFVVEEGMIVAQTIHYSIEDAGRD